MTKRFVGLLLLFVSMSACAQLNPGTIELTTDEKTEAVAIAEHRQRIAFRQQELQARFNADINRLNEEAQTVNIEASELCFQLKKVHKLDPGANYQLDEWKGQLVKR